MAKKRARDADGSASAMDVDNNGESDGDGEDFDMVNVEFEWFNFDPEIDFHGTKSLLRQLLDVDATLFDISALADLIIGQNGIGSTVKVDSKETDPYAMLTALNVREHRYEGGRLKALADYLASKASSTPSLSSTSLPSLLAPNSEPTYDASRPEVGLVLSERLINMPSEIAPPLYRMLEGEIEEAVEDDEPYRFTHYLVLSKTYREIESALGDEVVYEDESAAGGDRKGKKKKGKLSGADPKATFYFHPEDEVLHRYAEAHGSYSFTKHDENAADSKRAFQDLGIAPMGHMILLDAAKFKEAIKAVGEYLSPPS